MSWCLEFSYRAFLGFWFSRDFRLLKRSVVGASLLAKNSNTPRLYRVTVSSLTIFASKLAPTKGYSLGVWLLRLQLHVLRCFQQITAVLNQKVQGVGYVGNIFEVGVFEGQAGKGFKQVRSGADALMGGGLDVFGFGLSVDDKRMGIGEVGA